MLVWCIPEKFKTREMCDKIVEKSPNFIKYIPDYFITREMCNKAFEKNPRNIYHIPDYFITEEMYKQYSVEIYDYKKRKEQKALIREQILPIAWHPDRVIDWCFDEDEKHDLNRLWGE